MTGKPDVNKHVSRQTGFPDNKLCSLVPTDSLRSLMREVDTRSGGCSLESCGALPSGSLFSQVTCTKNLWGDLFMRPQLMRLFYSLNSLRDL
jgi:hypothetical protein